MTRRRVPALALGLALATLVAGCTPARNARPTIRFWAMGREGEVVTELVRDFERENPGIRVVVQQIPWSAAHEKLLTAHVGRSTPDVAQLGNTWIAEFGALRALEPLDARIARSHELAPRDFFDGVWATNVLDGQTFGVPWYVDTRVLFVRRDLLARAGYSSVPTTWAAWRRCLEDVRRVAGPDKYAILLPLNEWNAPVIFGMQAGSPLLRDHDTRSAFTEPEFREAWHFYTDLFRNHLAPAVANTEIANLYDEFARGYFSMYISGPWNLGEFRRRLPPALQDAWATAPLPGPGGDSTRVSLAGGSSLVVFRRSRHPDEAWRLVEFLSRPRQQKRFWQLTGDLPARLEPWSDAELAADANTAAFGEQLRRVRPLPKVPECELIMIRVQDWVDRAVRGGMDPDSALAGLDREVNRILEKRRWLLERSGVVAAERVP